LIRISFWQQQEIPPYLIHALAAGILRGVDIAEVIIQGLPAYKVLQVLQVFQAKQVPQDSMV
jgi:hypothetical protein